LDLFIVTNEAWLQGPPSNKYSHNLSGKGKTPPSSTSPSSSTNTSNVSVDQLPSTGWIILHTKQKKSEKRQTQQWKEKAATKRLIIKAHSKKQPSLAIDPPGGQKVLMIEVSKEKIFLPTCLSFSELFL
jgi:hypothetical protein